MKKVVIVLVDTISGEQLDKIPFKGDLQHIILKLRQLQYGYCEGKDRPRVRGTNKKLYAVSNCDYSYGCIIN